jgi:tripartite-type tricarboxylate transporter receptor subunit TctC
LSNVPNAREAGFRAMTQMVGWTALMGPPGLPADVVRYWKQTLQTVARDPVWLATNARLGGQPTIRLLTRPDVFVNEQYRVYQRLSPLAKGVP